MRCNKIFIFNKGIPSTPQQDAACSASTGYCKSLCMLAGAQRLTGRAAIRAALRGGPSGTYYRAAFSIHCCSYPTQPRQAILAVIEQQSNRAFVN